MCASDQLIITIVFSSFNDALHCTSSRRVIDVCCTTLYSHVVSYYLLFANRRYHESYDGEGASVVSGKLCRTE